MKTGRRANTVNPVPPDIVVEEVALKTGISTVLIYSTSSEKEISRARKVCYLMLRRHAGLTMKQTAVHFGKNSIDTIQDGLRRIIDQTKKNHKTYDPTLPPLITAIGKILRIRKPREYMPMPKKRRLQKLIVQKENNLELMKQKTAEEIEQLKEEQRRWEY